MSTNNVICKDDVNGSARVYISNGASPFTFIWNNDTNSILKLDESFSIIENLAPGDYFVEITDNNGCKVFDNFTISYNPKICLAPKKVFSPNNDGINDFWLIENIHIYPNALIEIYSKNGTQVFRRRNYTNSFEYGFKGIDSNNNNLPSGTYYYIIQLDDKKDAIYKMSDHDLPDHPAREREIKTGAEFYKEDIDRRPLVGKHPIDGREYLYFMVPYIVGAFENGERINHEALYEELWEKLFNSRNMKHHVFRKGDLLLMDQLHTTHRRSPVKRKIRKLWRCAFDYSNIDFT